MFFLSKCSICGRRGHGLQGIILMRSCVVCHKEGCDKCLDLYYVISSTSAYDFRKMWVGDHKEGCCSPQCYERYVISEITKNPEQIINKGLLHEDDQDRIVMTKILGKPEFYAATLIWLVNNYKTLDATSLEKLIPYLDKTLPQGLTMMHEGHKSLDYTKITDGLRLCRNDPIYNKEIKTWVDELAREYIRDLKSFDVPTSKAEIGGVTITLTMPATQKEMKVQRCPSCGANIDKIAVRGQVVKCDYCHSVIQIT